MSEATFAVVGATGVVGRKMLTILDEYGVPYENITALASAASQDKEVSYGEDHTLKVKALSTFDFSSVIFALFSAGSAISEEYALKAAEAGCIVIDNTSHFRMDPDVALVIPEVNGEALKNYNTRRIVSNPNCSTIQLAMALKPLHDINPVQRVIVSTYQSVSGAGQKAMQELMDSSKGIFMGQEKKTSVFTKPITFNAIPHIDVFLKSGETKEEWKMRVEIQKLIDPSIRLSATCVRLPIFIGHSISAYVECENPIDVDAVRSHMETFEGLCVVDDPENAEYITPIEAQNMDDVYISRLRVDPHNPNGMHMWVVADNLRKGAALNSVQIAEMICEDYL